MDTNDLDLSKPELKKIVLCAFIMSGVDGYIDEDEVEVIREFTENCWDDSFGDIDDFFIEIDSEVVNVFVPSKGKFNLDENVVVDILKDVSLDVVHTLKGLMIKVMEADGVIDPAEIALIQVIERYIEKRSSSQR